MKTFFSAVFLGVVLFVKYAFLALCFIIAAGCFLCAGKHYGGLK